MLGPHFSRFRQHFHAISPDEFAFCLVRQEIEQGQGRQILLAADRALYQAKQSGRNQVRAG